MAILEPDLPTLRYQLIKQANQTLHAPVLYKTQVKDQPPKSKTVCEIHEKKRKRKRERGKKKKARPKYLSPNAMVTDWTRSG